jgi:hypothetical protein
MVHFRRRDEENHDDTMDTTTRAIWLSRLTWIVESTSKIEAGSDNTVPLCRHAVAVAGFLRRRFLIGAGERRLWQIRRFVAGQA